jgi:hypothetical protein
VQVGDVEPADRVLVGLVAAVAADPLVAAGAERLVALPGEDDDADRGVFPGHGEGLGDLDDGLRAEGVMHLRPADGDLRDAVVAGLVPDVGVFAGFLPGDPRAVSLRAVSHGLHSADRHRKFSGGDREAGGRAGVVRGDIGSY